MVFKKGAMGSEAPLRPFGVSSTHHPNKSINYRIHFNAAVFPRHEIVDGHDVGNVDQSITVCVVGRVSVGSI